MNLRIAMVTYNWPPRNAIGTFRPFAWTKYWARAGVEVVVLTSEKQDFDEPLDLALAAPDGVRVVEVPVGGRRGRSAGAVAWWLPVAKRFKRWLGNTLGVVVDPRDGWVRRAGEEAAAIAHESDVVVSSYGPRACHEIAAKMKLANPALVWIADYRDLWSQNHLAHLGSRARRAETLREVRVISGADALTTVSEELATQLEDLHRKRVVVVPNGFDPDDYPNEDPGPSDAIRIVYTGMIYEGSRDPTPLFVAVRRMLDAGELAEGDLMIDFYGPPSAWLGQLIDRHRLSGFVRQHGRVRRDVAMKVQREATMLLLLESGSPEARGVLTGKLFEYLAIPRPIMSLGSGGDSAIARVLQSTRSGRAFADDVGAIRMQLAELVKREAPNWFAPDREEIDRYSRKVQAAALLELAGELLPSRRGVVTEAGTP